MPNVTPFLWFNADLQEVTAFYARIFPDLRVEFLSPMNARFAIGNQEFMALNGGPQFKFNEAFSIFINCETQDEVDRLWTALIRDGGAEGRCGWLKDKFGLSWQVVPSVLGRYLGDADRAKADRVLQAMLKMNKLDISTLDAAYRG